MYRREGFQVRGVTRRYVCKASSGKEFQVVGLLSYLYNEQDSIESLYPGLKKVPFGIFNISSGCLKSLPTEDYIGLRFECDSIERGFKESNDEFWGLNGFEINGMDRVFYDYFLLLKP